MEKQLTQILGENPIFIVRRNLLAANIPDECLATLPRESARVGGLKYAVLPLWKLKGSDESQYRIVHLDKALWWLSKSDPNLLLHKLRLIREIMDEDTVHTVFATNATYDELGEIYCGRERTLFRDVNAEFTVYSDGRLERVDRHSLFPSLQR